ncbi:MAG: hypothetical protein J6A21_04595 [Lentisphaeria bacterium]|nr:hypothetical protein [Lentisphaeria bacterium]
MKKVLNPAMSLAAVFVLCAVLSGCCTKEEKTCTAVRTSPQIWEAPAKCLPGEWQMYGKHEDGTLKEAPVVMIFAEDGTVTTLIEGKEKRSSSWKAEEKYIVLHRENHPSVRLEIKGNDQLEFEWRGDKYKEKGLKIILKRK